MLSNKNKMAAKIMYAIGKMMELFCETETIRKQQTPSFGNKHEARDNISLSLSLKYNFDHTRTCLHVITFHQEDLPFFLSFLKQLLGLVLNFSFI